MFLMILHMIDDNDIAMRSILGIPITRHFSSSGYVKPFKDQFVRGRRKTVCHQWNRLCGIISKHGIEIASA